MSLKTGLTVLHLSAVAQRAGVGQYHKRHALSANFMCTLQEGDNPAAMLQPVGAMAAAAHRLVIEPRVDESSSHDCQLCPANLCKVRWLEAARPADPPPVVCERESGVRPLQGQEVQALRQKPGFGRIVYCGDGANDLCPALTLGPDDYVRVSTRLCMRAMALLIVISAFMMMASFCPAGACAPRTCSGQAACAACYERPGRRRSTCAALAQP